MVEKTAKDIQDWILGVQPPKALTTHSLVLVCGPDEGGVSQMISDLKLKDAQNLKLSIEDLKQNALHSALRQGGGLFAQKQNIIIANVTDALTDTVFAQTQGMDLNPEETRVFLAGGDLKKTGKLRKRFDQRDSTGVSVTLYPLEERDKRQAVQTRLKRENMTAQPGVVDSLLPTLPADRCGFLSALNVVILHAQGAGRQTLTEDDTRLFTPDREDESPTLSLDHALMKNLEAALDALDAQNPEKNANAIPILRFWTSRLQRFLSILDQGGVAAAKPPVFWKEQSLVETILKRQKRHTLESHLGLMDKLEHDIVHRSVPAHIALRGALHTMATT